MTVKVVTTDLGTVTFHVAEQFASDGDGELYIGTSALRKDAISVFAKGTWVYAHKGTEVPTAVPRVWQSAEQIPAGVVVSDSDGDLWLWIDGSRYYKSNWEGSRWDQGADVTQSDSEWVEEYAPFTEYLESE